MALGAGTFSSLGGAVSDLFQGDALRAKAQGNRIEAQQYTLASQLATQNEQYTEQSTAIKQMQEDRTIYKTLGSQQADVASAGFAASGSALDLLADSAAQGALTKSVIAQQGLIEEASYKEQAQSYTLMSSAANLAAQADENAAKGSTITGILKGVASVASLF